MFKAKRYNKRLFAFCSQIHTPGTPNSSHDGPSQPESQIGTIEPSVTESEIPSPNGEDTPHTFPTSGTQVHGTVI